MTGEAVRCGVGLPPAEQAAAIRARLAPPATTARRHRLMPCPFPPTPLGAPRAGAAPGMTGGATSVPGVAGGAASVPGVAGGAACETSGPSRRHGAVPPRRSMPGRPQRPGHLVATLWRGLSSGPLTAGNGPGGSRGAGFQLRIIAPPAVTHPRTDPGCSRTSLPQEEAATCHPVTGTGHTPRTGNRRFIPRQRSRRPGLAQAWEKPADMAITVGSRYRRPPSEHRTAVTCAFGDRMAIGASHAEWVAMCGHRVAAVQPAVLTHGGSCGQLYRRLSGPLGGAAGLLVGRR